MSMIGRDTSDSSSVTFTLAELAKLEAERCRDEEAQRAHAREKAAQDKRDADAKKAQAEAQRLAAEAEAKAKKDHEAAVEKARLEARERAAADVAHIQAEAAARLEADNAQRAHEIALVRIRTESSARKLRTALAVVVGAALLGAGGAAISVSRQVTSLEQETAALREGQTALTHEREQAKQSELAALDKRHAALRERALGAAQHKTLGVGRDVEAASIVAETARATVDPKALDHDRMRAFADALDALQARIETLETVAALDQRKDDLDAWAGERRKSDALSTKVAAAKDAAQKARAAGAGKADAKAYEVALGHLHDAIAQAGTGTGTGGRGGGARTETLGAPCTPGLDPLCGPDGHLITSP